MNWEKINYFLGQGIFQATDAEGRRIYGAAFFPNQPSDCSIFYSVAALRKDMRENSTK